MQIFCKYCFNQGIRNGTSVYRPTSIKRKGWYKPEDYYVLSPSHVMHSGAETEEDRKHPAQLEAGIQSRSTVPAWMLHGVLISTLVALIRDVMTFHHLVAPFRKRIGGDKNLKIKLEEIYLEKKDTEDRIRQGSQELINMSNSPYVLKMLREELTKLDALVKEQDERIKGLDTEVKVLDTLGEPFSAWERLLNIRSEDESLAFLGHLDDPFEVFVDFILVSKDFLEVHFNLDFIARISLPEQIRKTNTEYEVIILHSSPNLPSLSYPLDLTNYVEKDPNNLGLF